MKFRALQIISPVAYWVDFLTYPASLCSCGWWVLQEAKRHKITTIQRGKSPQWVVCVEQTKVICHSTVALWHHRFCSVARSGTFGRKKVHSNCHVRCDLDGSNLRDRTLLGKKLPAIQQEIWSIRGLHWRQSISSYLLQRGQKIHSSNNHSICRGLFYHHLLMTNIDWQVECHMSCHLHYCAHSRVTRVAHQAPVHQRLQKTKPRYITRLTIYRGFK